MERPSRFEHSRYIGDKRSQVVHDLDSCTSSDVIDELMNAETYLSFGPDTLPEARNRGYRLCRRCCAAS
jgi:CRISPR/Cas system-associated protein Csx1